MLYTKFHPNILSGSGENADFISLLFLVSATIFSSQPD